MRTRNMVFLAEWVVRRLPFFVPVYVAKRAKSAKQMFPIQFCVYATGARPGHTQADYLLWALESRIQELTAQSLHEDECDPDSDYDDLIEEIDVLREMQREFTLATITALGRAQEPVSTQISPLS